jgi:hypothetical protein
MATRKQRLRQEAVIDAPLAKATATATAKVKRPKKVSRGK